MCSYPALCLILHIYVDVYGWLAMKILLVKHRLQWRHYATKTCLSTLDLGRQANRRCTLYRVFGFYIDALDLEERLSINIHSYISSKSSFSFFIFKM